MLRESTSIKNVDRFHSDSAASDVALTYRIDELNDARRQPATAICDKWAAAPRADTGVDRGCVHGAVR